MTDTTDLPYRPCVGVALFSREGLVFVGKRFAAAGPEHVAGAYSWQMPQGGIDPGEDPLVAARRELEEETGVRSATLLGESADWYAYDLPPGVTAWKGRWRGQIQKWFAFRFEGEESEIDIASPGGHEPEFEAWRWERLERVPELIIPFKRGVYERVVADFSRFARPVG
ncbi:RNA pyrophosphohydrolase [Salinarimonas sp.]|uniref:RNA pyrophosphohydrolase n=1 Tax=Salinarimonas sp. TaxID=2766526 RepID=UPI00391A2D6B